MKGRWIALVAAVLAIVAIVAIVLVRRGRLPSKKPGAPPPVARRGIPRPKVGEAPKKLTRAEILARYASGERDFTDLIVEKDQLDDRKLTLDSADLSRARWIRINVSGSFQKTKLRSAVLMQVSALDADFSGADFQDATLKMGEFPRGCQLKGASFHRAYLYDTNFGDCDLTETDFTQAVIIGGNFSKAKLDGAKFEDALYTSAALWPPGFSRENMRSLNAGADLHGLDFSGRVLGGDDPIKFERANLQNASFRGADLVDLVFTGADLRSADFTGANILHAKFQGANLEGAIFKDAVGQASNVELEARGAIIIRPNANLRNVDFTGMTLYPPLVFDQADLRGAIFKETHLKDVNFNYSNLEGADFERSTMYRTIFRCSDLTNVNMKDVRGYFTGQLAGQTPEPNCLKYRPPPGYE